MAWATDKLAELFSERSVFLIDGVGAAVSAIVLAVLFPQMPDWIGMPVRVLYLLAIVPVFYAAYSLCCHFARPVRWRRFLKVIAIANLVYCVISICVVAIHWNQLTNIGVVYFAGEVVLIVVIAAMEWRLATRCS